MPKQMPRDQLGFLRCVDEALKLAEIGEVARAEAALGSRTKDNFHHSRVELLYELAYLKIFVSWEDFLENAFIRYLCDYRSAAGSAICNTDVSFERTLTSAAATLFGTKKFLLWHNPKYVIQRSDKYFSDCPIKSVVLSNFSRLEHLSAIRHRIAHSQSDAKEKFDVATMNFVGRRYRGSRAGSFLREFDGSSYPHVRWVERLGDEFKGLASQIA